MAISKLFVLRAYWTVTWNDADDGLVDVCETYCDINFSSDQDALQAIADDLAKGHTGCWTEDRADRLRQLWPQYDDMGTYIFKVEDIAGLVVPCRTCKGRGEVETGIGMTPCPRCA